MFIKELVLIAEDNVTIKHSREFDTRETMESFPLSGMLNRHAGLFIQDRIVNEYEDKKLLKSYEYYDPTPIKVSKINPENGSVAYDNGMTISTESYDLTKSMEMAVIEGYQVPLSIMWRVKAVMLPDNWYSNTKKERLFDTVACGMEYDAKVGYESILGIWFGFIRVKEGSASNNFVWKFNSIYMNSTISKERRDFGNNTFQDSDFERLAPFIGFKGNKEIMKLANEGDDMAIAKKLKLKRCNYTSIFDLCNATRAGKSI
jgi:hypothetical protein